MAVGQVPGAGETKYELSSKVPTMDILLDILLITGLVCCFGPLIYHWRNGDFSRSTTAPAAQHFPSDADVMAIVEERVDSDASRQEDRSRGDVS